MARAAGARPEARRRLRLVLLVLLLVLALRLAWVHETRYPVRSPGAPPQPLVVPPGASADAIGRQLHGMGLVRHPLVFRVLVLVRGAGGELKAGEYSLEGPVSLTQIVDLLTRGEVVRRDVTFPEGRSIEDMAQLAAARGIAPGEFLEAARDPGPIRDIDPLAVDLEGYLFPDTYDLPRAENPAAALVARMVGRFREVISPDLARLPSRELTVRQLVTLASLVEMETARPEERPRIAAVFLNRLQKGMPLQTDPTVIFAMRKAGRWNGNIRKKDLEIDSPYNTYRVAGLPPGPIASPGRGSLLAVIEPAPVRDLYFVSRNDGTHEFSETLGQHNRAVERYQRQRRGGPSSAADPGASKAS